MNSITGRCLEFFITVSFFLLAVVASSQSIAQEIPSATDVIDDYIQALGGEMHLNSLSSFKLTGTYNSKEFLVHYHEGTLCWVGSGGKNVYWVDDKRRFWQRQRGVFALRDDLSPGYPSGFINLPVEAIRWLDDDELKLTNLGAEDLNGVATWRILFEVEGQNPSERIFDQESGLLLETRLKGTKSAIKRYEYSMLDECLFATTARLDERGRTLTFQKLEIDPDHGDVDFSLPEKLELEWQEKQSKAKPESTQINDDGN